MTKKARYVMDSDSTDYRKGYADGMKAAFEESELDAYYAGVGYGKKAAGDKHIGFNNAEERRQFEAGIQKRDSHFNAYRTKEPTFIEKLLGGAYSRRTTINTNGVEQRKNRIQRARRVKHKCKTRKKR